MREILIFAGTTEGRKLSEVLCDSGIHHRICVATEYGEILLKHHPCRKIHRGRMEPEEMRDFIEYIGHPLPGDYLYNPDYRKIQRQPLHSYQLEFTHPVTKKAMLFTAPVPEDFISAF